MTTLGSIFLPTLPPERLRSVAHAADAAGLEELWLWEDCFKESGIAPLAAALAWTERLHIGIGLLPVPMRNVATVAMEAATLERLFPRRAILGVGHGVLDWMGQIGARAESPLTLLGEHLDALRALLAGERLTVDGRYVRLTDVALDWPPPAAPAVLAGAEGPRTLELVGAKADGVILPAGTSPRRLREAVERFRAGRAAAGRGDGGRVVVFVAGASGPRAEQRLDANRERWGAPAEDYGIAGDAAAFAEGIARWVAAGADAVVLQPMDDDPEPEAYMRFVAEEVRPLVP